MAIRRAPIQCFAINSRYSVATASEPVSNNCSARVGPAVATPLADARESRGAAAVVVLIGRDAAVGVAVVQQPLALGLQLRLLAGKAEQVVQGGDRDDRQRMLLGDALCR